MPIVSVEVTSMRGGRPNTRKFLPDDPFDDVMFVDSQGLAGELQDVLDAISPYDSTTIKAVISKKRLDTSGKYDWIETIEGKINMDEIASSLKARFGGGDYRVTIFAGGKTRRVIELPIMGEAKSSKSASTGGNFGGDGDFFRMYLMMQKEQRETEQQYRRDQAEREERYQRERAEDRRQSTALFQSVLVAAIPALIPVLTGANREKLGDLLAIMKGAEGEKTSLKETLETVTLVKALFEDKDKNGFDPDDIAGSVMRLAGPVAGALGRAVRGGETPPAADAAAPLYLPPPGAPIVPPAPAAAPAAALPADPAARVVTLIGPHVMYFYNTGSNPDLAAEHIVAIMRREGVTEDEVLALVATFTVSPDWRADLAAQGFDLRGNPDWADDLLDALRDEWTQSGGNRDRAAGGGWRMADASDHAEVGAQGLNGSGDPGAGGPTH